MRDIEPPRIIIQLHLYIFKVNQSINQYLTLNSFWRQYEQDQTKRKEPSITLLQYHTLLQYYSLFTIKIIHYYFITVLLYYTNTLIL